jgi:hypothetical protein
MKLATTFLLASAALASAASISITTADGTGADTHIRSDVGGASPNNAFNYGAATAMLLGSNAGNSPTGALNLLMRFDLAALQAATGGSAITVNSVTLSFVTTSAGGSSGGLPFTVGLFDYGFAFVEGTASGTAQAGSSTYNNPAGGGADTTAGGTAGTSLQSISVTTVAGATTWTFSTSSAFVSDLQGAYTGSGASTVNYLLKETGGLATDQNFIRVNSGEASTGLKPTLTIDYTVVPEPSAALLGGLGLLALLRRRRA